MKEIYQKLKAISGKNYGFYKQLSSKTFDFGDFEICFEHIQGDPYAPPSRVLLHAPLSLLNWPNEFANTKIKQKALSDFLHRELALVISEIFPEKNDVISCLTPAQTIKIRNTVWIDHGNISILLNIRLPGEKRLIDGSKAIEILTFQLPDLLTAVFYANSEKKSRAEKAIQNIEQREFLLQEIQKENLVAFIPDGAVLPRESGLSDLPAVQSVPFKAPEGLSKTFTIGGKEIRGMGIPKGITVITGGAYHGKSTLLAALEQAVYPHVAGDGREGIVIDESAVRVRTEEGRSVRHADISLLVRELPGKKSTTDFTTAAASGSTSEAANLLEALEFGSKTFLIDEDSSAVNFLVRDARVRELVGNTNEPLIPLIDRIRDLADIGYNFILVAGACGAYLDKADQVILMEEFQAKAVTQKAKEICSQYRLKHQVFQEESNKLQPDKMIQAKQSAEPQMTCQSIAASFVNCRNCKTFTEELLPSVKPLSALERFVKVRLAGQTLQIGFLSANIASILGFNAASALGAGFFLLNILQNPEDKPLNQLIQERFKKVENTGFRALSQGMSKDLELPRPEEIAAVLFRLRDYGK